MTHLIGIDGYLHKLNIFLHVGFASVAIILAIIQLLNSKGGPSHRRFGRIFLQSYTVVICSAVLGSAIFNFRVFLLTLTAAAAYSCIAGYRVLKLKGARPERLDNSISIISLALCVCFALIVTRFLSPLSAATTYATISSLAAYCVYDLARNYMSQNWLKRTWLYEHITKMISAFSALLSAASGNLFPQYGATAQLSPIFFCLALTVSFIVLSKHRKEIRRSTKRGR